MIRRFGVLAALAVTAAAVAACGTTNSSSSGGAASSSSSGTPFKVAWIYIGAPTDAGWTAAHDAGRK
jgi:simple sugar transport system substrate-binding protein